MSSWIDIEDWLPITLSSWNKIEGKEWIKLEGPCKPKFESWIPPIWNLNPESKPFWNMNPRKLKFESWIRPILKFESNILPFLKFESRIPRLFEIWIQNPWTPPYRDSGVTFQTDPGFWSQFSKRARFRIQISSRVHRALVILVIQDSYILKPNRNLDIRASSRAQFIFFKLSEIQISKQFSGIHISKWLGFSLFQDSNFK